MNQNNLYLLRKPPTDGSLSLQSKQEERLWSQKIFTSLQNFLPIYLWKYIICTIKDRLSLDLSLDQTPLASNFTLVESPTPSFLDFTE